MKQLKLLLLFFFTAILSSAQSIPAIKAKALDNSEITLPSPGSQQFLILIVGFSQKSGKLCEVWGRYTVPPLRGASGERPRGSAGQFLSNPRNEPMITRE